ncbi:MAG TPA: hypothetical protein VK772_01510 [Puia sp.]|jgi:hypothetical protein|nr:hypothetical protein [Puia sp.]
MIKTLILSFFLFISIWAAGQNTAYVDKKSKEFIFTPTPKSEFEIVGYEYANISTKRMICFSSNSNLVSDNMAKCPLGAYFETGRMKEGDRIFYLGKAGSFSKMNFVSGTGKKTIFYFPKGSFVIK